MKLHDIVLIPGDGIGPEVTTATQRILAAAQAPLRWVEHRAGLAAIEAGLDVLPQETLDAIVAHGVALKGPCTTPVGEGFSSVNVQLRKRLNLYAAVRPVRSLEGVATRFAGVDLVIVRENTEGLYSGAENRLTDDVVISMKVATQTACDRIARWGFGYAVQRQRRKVTVFHKANIMKLTDGLFLKCARQVHEQRGREMRGRDQPCLGRVGQVVPGPVASRLADDGDVAEARVARMERIPPQPQPLQRGEAARRHQQLRGREQLRQRSRPRVRLEVEPDDTLAASELVVPRANVGREGVAGGRLDLRHVGAEVAEPGARERARQVHGERHDARAVEWRGIHLPKRGQASSRRRLAG